jgi:protein-S-isoprenylcysteine O-methyltransferase Ste14
MLKHTMARQGAWFFRWRSYLPFVFIPFGVAAFIQSGWVTASYGHTVEDGVDVFCLFVSLLGLSLRIATVGFAAKRTSGRNSRAQQADTLNTTGMYSLVRHPLYLANFLVFLGFIFLQKSLLLAVLAGALFFFYYERIMMAEEEFLEKRFGERYREWASRTPALLPRTLRWVKPQLEFSWRAALRGEFHTIFLIAAVFFVNELLEASVIEGQSFTTWLRDEPLWAIFALGAAVFYAGVRIIRKHTGWLRTTDR